MSFKLSITTNAPKPNSVTILEVEGDTLVKALVPALVALQRPYYPVYIPVIAEQLEDGDSVIFHEFVIELLPESEG